jgi:hypothetical protein
MQVCRCEKTKQKNIVACALRAIEASSGLWHKRGVFFRERRGRKLQQNVVLNPLLQVPNRKQDALDLVAVGVLLLIASSEGFLLLRGLQLGKQKGMAQYEWKRAIAPRYAVKVSLLPASSCSMR